MRDDVIIAAGICIAGYIVWSAMSAEEGGDTTSWDGISDTVLTTFDEVVGTFTTSTLEDMKTSAAGLDMLKRREKLLLTRTDLGDGGWTIGYGHFEKNINDLPASVDEPTALAIFADDVTNRAEKWVKLYVTVPVTQQQFDALVSIAFNMSPRSFKKFADQVNAGNGIDGIAAQSVSWVDPKFTNGIRNRRETEVNLFNQGVYA